MNKSPTLSERHKLCTSDAAEVVNQTSSSVVDSVVAVGDTTDVNGIKVVSPKMGTVTSTASNGFKAVTLPNVKAVTMTTMTSAREKFLTFRSSDAAAKKVTNEASFNVDKTSLHQSKTSLEVDKTSFQESKTSFHGSKTSLEVDASTEGSKSLPKIFIQEEDEFLEEFDYQHQTDLRKPPPLLHSVSLDEEFERSKAGCLSPPHSPDLRFLSVPHNLNNVMRSSLPGSRDQLHKTFLA